LANPDPEILPEHAHEVRPDVIMATGRSDCFYVCHTCNCMYTCNFHVFINRCCTNVKRTTENVIFALANPDPEILPEHAHEVRPDVIMATGRSDYPNAIRAIACTHAIFMSSLIVVAPTSSAPRKM
jgi:malic enzyme